ncbi:MAG: regulatory iron-sulfur-containing complex subunit RicT [Bacteroidales bacterium]
MKNNDGSNGLRARGCLNVPNAYEKVALQEIHSTAKLDIHHWLNDMHLPVSKKPFNIAEVRFKNSRKGFFVKPDEMMLEIGDLVAVEANPGHDIGLVSLTGDLVKIQMKKSGINKHSDQVKQIYRRARATDIEKWEHAIEREKATRLKAREVVNQLGLDMKINDVEFQGDGTKAIFYYTAEGRVDFRQLIKDLAREFSIRIEMKQIGARQESARIGGIGSCGRELCCATWLKNFRSVSTNVAREQQLSLNPQKLAGQCGKLKCCLNYEYDVYVDALKHFPRTDTTIDTEKGKAFHQKTDIFKKIMWFSYRDNTSVLVPVPLDGVKKMIAMNQAGKLPETLEQYSEPKEKENQDSFTNVVGQDDLHRFDKKPNEQKNQQKKRKGKSIKNRVRKQNEQPANNKQKNKRRNKPS